MGRKVHRSARSSLRAGLTPPYGFSDERPPRSRENTYCIFQRKYGAAIAPYFFSAAIPPIWGCCTPMNHPPVPWADILRTAITRALEGRHGAIPGARLRLFVQLAAAESGQPFPPADEPNFRFGQFLLRYPEIVTVRRRPGQDFLVVPADRPDLLVDTPREPIAAIRPDLFVAFTRLLTDERAWYIRDRDAVEWQPASVTVDGAIPIPPARLGDALAVRRGFVETCSDPAVRERLTRALESPRSLTAFTGVVRAAGLQRDWHVYRTKALTEQIARWAKDAGIEWKDTWLTSSATQEPEYAPSGGSLSHFEWRRALTWLVQSLDESDLARISVPLDIVLKALARRR